VAACPPVPRNRPALIPKLDLVKKLVEIDKASAQVRQMTKPSPFRHSKTSPEIIRKTTMLRVQFPMSPRNVGDMLHERGIEICHGKQSI
jgi:hypothetical protein